MPGPYPRSRLPDTASVDLYALAPEDFTAARDAEVKAARQAGDRERAKALAALRRPTASAHAVNALVRAEPELVEQLVDLGRQLGEAQAGGQRDALRELGEQRRLLVEAVADRAGQASGRSLTAAVRGEVTATLEAALADPASGEAVRSGRLVRALSYAGFGGVDLEGAVAEAPALREPAASPSDPGPPAAGPDRTALERAAQQAAGALDDAVRAAERAEQARRRQRAEAERSAGEAREAQSASAQAEREAREAADEAARAARRADRLAAAATAAAEHLSRVREHAEAAAEGSELAEQALRERHAQVQAAQAAAEQARAALDQRTRSR